MIIKDKKNRDIWSLITSLVFLLYILILVIPLLSLLIKSLIDQSNGSLSPMHFAKFFSKKYFYNTLFNSLKISVAVTVLTIIVATPLAYIMTNYKIRGKTIMQVMIVISSMQAPFIGAYSWVQLLGRNGVITNVAKNVFNVKNPDIYGFRGMLLVFTLQLTPLIFMYLSGALKNIDASLLEAAELMGYTGIKKITKVIFPLIVPTLLAGSLLVFMRTFSDFGTPMLIGEGYRTVPVLIFNEFINEMGGDDGFAAAVSVISISIATGIFLLQKYVSSKKSFSMSALNPMESKQEKGLKNILGHLYVYGFTVLAMLPQIYVIYTSFLKTSGRIFIKGYSLMSYNNAFTKIGNSITNTFALAGIAMMIILIAAVLTAYAVVRRSSTITNFLDAIIMFPYIVPGSILGIALLFSFNKRPILLSGTPAIIIMAYVIRRLPYTIRSSAAILHNIGISTEEAAISLGASNLKTFFKITLPMMIPGVVSGAILSWITIISELSTSIILYTTRTKTMTIAIYTEVIRGNYGVAAALASILLLITVSSLLIFFKVTGRKEITMS